MTWAAAAESLRQVTDRDDLGELQGQDCRRVLAAAVPWLAPIANRAHATRAQRLFLPADEQPSAWAVLQHGTKLLHFSDVGVAVAGHIAAYAEWLLVTSPPRDWATLSLACASLNVIAQHMARHFVQTDDRLGQALAEMRTRLQSALSSETMDMPNLHCVTSILRSVPYLGFTEPVPELAGWLDNWLSTKPPTYWKGLDHWHLYEFLDALTGSVGHGVGRATTRKLHTTMAADLPPVPNFYALTSLWMFTGRAGFGEDHWGPTDALTQEYLARSALLSDSAIPPSWVARFARHAPSRRGRASRQTISDVVDFGLAHSDWSTAGRNDVAPLIRGCAREIVLPETQARVATTAAAALKHLGTDGWHPRDVSDLCAIRVLEGWQVAAEAIDAILEDLLDRPAVLVCALPNQWRYIFAYTDMVPRHPLRERLLPLATRSIGRQHIEDWDTLSGLLHSAQRLPTAMNLGSHLETRAIAMGRRALRSHLPLPKPQALAWTLHASEDLAFETESLRVLDLVLGRLLDSEQFNVNTVLATSAGVLVEAARKQRLNNRRRLQQRVAELMAEDGLRRPTPLALCRLVHGMRTSPDASVRNQVVGYALVHGSADLPFAYLNSLLSGLRLMEGLDRTQREIIAGWLADIDNRLPPMGMAGIRNALSVLRSIETMNLTEFPAGQRAAEQICFALTQALPRARARLHALPDFERAPLEETARNWELPWS